TNLISTIGVGYYIVYLFSIIKFGTYSQHKEDQMGRPCAQRINNQLPPRPGDILCVMLSSNFDLDGRIPS
ncbi:hypothetical protein BDR04DRAFT_1096856, partial [Suillus decipiens]